MPALRYRDQLLENLAGTEAGARWWAQIVSIGTPLVYSSRVGGTYVAVVLLHRYHNMLVGLHSM